LLGSRWHIDPLLLEIAYPVCYNTSPNTLLFDATQW
jgi:hypothetical protein